MAEFCRQCSIDVFGEDSEDFKGLSTPEDTENEMYCVVLCEGCAGMIQVDHEGNRVTPYDHDTNYVRDSIIHTGY